MPRNQMDLNQAIQKRIAEICRDTGMSICKISLGGGMTPSAIYDVLKNRVKNPTITTLKRFCEGADITLAQFFDREYFNDWIED